MLVCDVLAVPTKVEAPAGRGVDRRRHLSRQRVREQRDLTATSQHTQNAAALSVLHAWPVSAAPIAIDFADHVGPLDRGFVDLTFNSPGPGVGTLTFDLIGYLTVDGANTEHDSFFLNINGPPGVMLLILLGAAVRFRWRGWLLIGTSLVLAGGASNWVDRLVRGSVVDFLNIGVGPLRTGIFNVADMAIMLGVAILLLVQLRRSDEAGPTGRHV